jgi:hypothetical protein
MGQEQMIFVPTTTQLQTMVLVLMDQVHLLQRAAYDNFISQDSYLSGRRGQYSAMEHFLLGEVNGI